MIPISDYPPQRRTTPYVMLALVALNTIIFIYETLLGANLNSFLFAFGVVPFEISHGRDISPIVPFPVYLTLITSMFLHGGILHLAGNMLFLWVFGDNVEDSLGHITFLIYYIVCGLAAGLTQVAISPDEQIPVIGASGAISGVLAAYLVLFPRAQVRTLLFIGPFFTLTRISAFFLIGFWIVLQFAIGFLTLGEAGGGVAYFAHIGGFVAGLLITYLFRFRRQ